jgi:hypothetical protein
MAIVGGLFVAGQGGSGGDDFSDLRYAVQPVSPGTSPEPVTGSQLASPDTCGVTFQQENLDNLPMGWGSYDTAYGGEGLRVTLPNGGVLRAGSSQVNEQGEIWDKFLFWSNSGSDGAALEVSGRRLDVESGPLRAEIGAGTGAMAVGLYFPTTGCWEVTGTLGDKSVRFVMLVVRVYEVPDGTATPISD